MRCAVQGDTAPTLACVLRVGRGWSSVSLQVRLALSGDGFYDFRVFRPCIDLHEGKVKQIVGGTLTDAAQEVRTNFVSEKSSAEFAELYRRDELRGGHVILLGPGNEEAARAALAAYPGGMQVGGGVNLDNAASWLDAGASQVIVTSWLFQAGRVDFDRLASLERKIGKQRLVLDLSCRRRGDDYWVVTDRWQTFTDVTVSAATLARLAEACVEFLVHAVDVEGLCRGIDAELVEKLGAESPIPVTYAGGASSLVDLERVTQLGKGRIDLTIGSALDIFGGAGVRYADAVAFNRRQARTS
jgi:phosphoribosylformimino-5-aminoimidazole carboxamide ribotide isomerase